MKILTQITGKRLGIKNTIEDLRVPYRRRELAKRVIKNALLAIGMFVIIFPIYWTFVTSISPQSAVVTRDAHYIPRRLTLGAYEHVLFGSGFPRYLLNTIVYAVGTVSLSIVISTLGGYGLTRLRIPQKRNFARAVLFGYMFSPILLAIPMFILWRDLGMINSWLGIILALTAITLPFNLWIMWKFFQTVPISLEEAAIMSGATRFQAFYQVALPVAKPGIIAVGLFAYASSWGAYTIPLILGPDPSMFHITVGIEEFMREGQTDMPAVMAAITISAIPGIAFAYYLQRYILEGFRIR